DPVLDAATPRACDRRPEAEIELARRHPDCTGCEEMAGLVDHHEQRQAEDCDDDAHATVTRSRARTSASCSSSRSRAAAPSTRASTSPTRLAISRKPMRPSRNAATATSL